ncbi:DUF2330 domain-containing protein [Candidatus Bathyarchaeota archaeon]|nr:DUF2330 domain-containing protein [Candidatus Bathyarchaeota archaeon]
MLRTRYRPMAPAIITHLSRFFKKVIWPTAVMLFLLSAVTFCATVTRADRCVLPTGDADVYGPGQKAIVAWNGEAECLILSTDLYASGDTRVLEVLPLPSKPDVEEGGFESFEAIQNLMMKNLPRAAGAEDKARLDIMFHERIGAHDVTVVRATSAEDLSRFIADYARGMNIPQPGIVERTRQILTDYLERGFNYWVFDLVNLQSDTRSLEPIIYKFQTQSLYYPLKVSSTAKGSTEILLYLITPGKLDEGFLPPKVRFAHYIPGDQPIQFQVTHEELASIDSRISALFAREALTYPPSPAAWLTAAKYVGELEDLDFDLEILSGSVQCRSIIVETDKSDYRLGEEVKITVNFKHLMPGCVEAAVLHTHEIRLDVVDSDQGTVRSWRWETGGDFQKSIYWRPDEADDYLVRAASWFNMESLEVEALVPIKVLDRSSISHSDLESRSFWIGVSVAAVCILLGVAAAYLMIRLRLRQAANATGSLQSTDRHEKGSLFHQVKKGYGPAYFSSIDAWSRPVLDLHP